MLVPDGHSIRAEGTRPHLEGAVSVVGLNGMFIRTRDSQPYGTVLPLKLTTALLWFEAECTVRNVAENGLGVEITAITPENEQKLKALLLQLRS